MNTNCFNVLHDNSIKTCFSSGVENFFLEKKKSIQFQSFSSLYVESNLTDVGNLAFLRPTVITESVDCLQIFHHFI